VRNTRDVDSAGLVHDGWLDRVLPQSLCVSVDEGILQEVLFIRQSSDLSEQCDILADLRDPCLDHVPVNQ